jgi:hypothetical protein
MSLRREDLASPDSAIHSISGCGSTSRRELPSCGRHDGTREPTGVGRLVPETAWGSTPRLPRMRLAKACVPVVLVAALLTGSPALASPSRAVDIPRPVSAAAKAMNCDIVNQIYSSPGEKPVFSGETCKTERFGYFTVRLYKNAKEATAYWLDNVLAGAPHAFIAKKGRLFVIPDDVDNPYTEAAARYAAKKIGGKAIHGRS